MNQRVRRKRRFDPYGKKTKPYQTRILPHDFIFIHIPKTAGGTTRQALKYEGITEHFSAQKVRNMIGQSEWDNRFSFSFVRNPWDRMVSWFFAHRKEISYYKYKEFGDWVRDGLPHHWHADTNWYAGNHERDPLLMTNFLLDKAGLPMVDFIGKFESLTEDLSFVFKQIGKMMPALGHVHKTPRKPHREYYDEETQGLVAEHCKRDIELFGYEF